MQPHEEAASSIVNRIEQAILFPLITLMASVALLIFLYGIYEYVLHADDEHARSEGRTHMLYGVIGLVVMVSAYAILKIATGTFGIDASIVTSPVISV